MADRPTIVLDASVIGHGMRDDELGDDCRETVLRAERMFALVLDVQDHIVDEYQRCIRARPQGPLGRWWVRVISMAVARHTEHGQLTRADEAKLLEAGFDNDDLPYVAVAQRSGGTPIVHEDSDYCDHESLIGEVARARCLHPGMFIRELDSAGRVNRAFA